MRGRGLNTLHQGIPAWQPHLSWRDTTSPGKRSADHASPWPRRYDLSGSRQASRQQTGSHAARHSQMSPHSVNEAAERFDRVIPHCRSLAPQVAAVVIQRRSTIVAQPLSARAGGLGCEWLRMVANQSCQGPSCSRPTAMSIVLRGHRRLGSSLASPSQDAVQKGIGPTLKSGHRARQSEQSGQSRPTPMKWLMFLLRFPTWAGTAPLSVLGMRGRWTKAYKAVAGKADYRRASPPHVEQPDLHSFGSNLVLALFGCVVPCLYGPV